MSDGFPTPDDLTPDAFPTPDGFPMPDSSSSMGHWAAYFAQDPLQRWRDIADALGVSPESAQGSGRGWGLRHGFPVPPRASRR
jgi:hypothetical protein